MTAATTRRHPDILLVTAAASGGVLRHVLDLATGCTAAGYTMALAIPRHAIRELPAIARLAALEDAGLRIDSFGLEPSIGMGSALRATRAISRFVEAQKIPLVHLHSSRAGALLRLMTRWRRSVRVVYTPNAFSFLLPRSRLTRLCYTAAERLAGRRTDALVAVSQSEKDLALHHRIIAPERVHLIPNGVPLPPPPRCATRPRPHRILSLGRLSPQKDPMTFLNVAERVCRVHDNVEFRWGGDGDLHEAVYAAWQRSPARHRIRMLGHIDDVEAELQGASIYLSTARYEGLPYAVLDALAHGLPVVLSDVPGNRDLVRDGANGRRFNPADPGEAAEAIAWLLEDTRRLVTAGETSRADAEGRFGLTAMIDAHVALYGTLLDR